MSALFVAAFCALFLAGATAASPLLVSPLIGRSGGGDPFDDGTIAVVPPVARLHALSICYGDFVDGIQLAYILEDNSTFVASPHGRVNKECASTSNMSRIYFKEDEALVRVEGFTHAYWQYVSQLTLFTSFGEGKPKLRGGPFGRGSDVPFSLTGDVRGIFGRSGDEVDAIGFYINSASALPLSFYNKTKLFGGGEGTDFDDFETLTSLNNSNSLKVTNIVINYAKTISGIKVTYMVSSKVSITVEHGDLTTDSSGQRRNSFLDFEADEWITKIDISSGSVAVLSLKIETTDSKGSIKSYGPFGEDAGNNATTVRGVVQGFYGRTSDPGPIRAIGFYT